MRVLEARGWLALAGFLLFCGCGGSTVDRDMESASLERIRAVADSFVAAIRDQEPESFARLFTSDATYASNDGHLWVGREEILAAAREWMQVPQEPTRTPVETRVSGDYAYVLDRYSSVVHLPHAPAVTITGKSLGVFERQEDGSWRIDALVVNRDP